MYIEELKEDGEQQSYEGPVVAWDPKRILVGAGARALFYPTLLYNVVRNKMQSEFRWWDRIDEFVLLGAVPFPTDVVHLKALGVGGVVTLNEPYETLVPTSLYHDHDIKHLVIPTRDYLFAPSYGDILQAVEFIHDNALGRKTTYVHCKAGRGRSTTVVLCYLVKYNEMTPEAAYEYVKSIRPRVLLASTQWQAVQNFYRRSKKPENDICVDNSSTTSLGFPKKANIEDNLVDDGSMVLITESDLEGYNETLAQANLTCRMHFMISRVSCLLLRQKASRNTQLGSMGVDVQVC